MLRLTSNPGEQLRIIDRLIVLYDLAAPRKLECTGKDGGPIKTDESKVVFYLPSNGRGDTPQSPVPSQP